MERKRIYTAPDVYCMTVDIGPRLLSASGPSVQSMNVYSDGDDDKITNSNQLLVKPRGLWDEMDFDEE